MRAGRDNKPTGFLKRTAYRASRAIVAKLITPTIVGERSFDAATTVYALANRSLADLLVLDIASAQIGSPGPQDPLASPAEQKRFFFLNRGTGITRKNTMRTYSRRLLRLGNALAAHETERIDVVPVSVFWGRAANKERSLVRSLLSDDWAVTSRIRRFLSLFFNRSDVLLHYGVALQWHELIEPERETTLNVRKLARLLRVRFRDERTAALGPDLSHRRTLVAQILRSRSVQEAIAGEAGKPAKLAKRARRNAYSIASNMSYPSIRFMESVLTWFWKRIYDGVDVQGIERIEEFSKTHTLIYAPSHRSHVDYLVLSYVLFHYGFMIPHIASGDNLNMPVVGALLRRGGAFFMRRSFRDDPIYRAVFSEYLYQVFRRGHSVEYFVEGGRTRTGRLLRPRMGMLQMTVESQERGVPRPIGIVPVYVGYEKLVEANSYLSELRGGSKRRESIGDVFRNLRLVRQHFGRVMLRFGDPIDVGHLPGEGQSADRRLALLGRRVLNGINACAHVNPVNLIALATLSMPRNAIDEHVLKDYIETLRALVRADSDHHDFSVTSDDVDDMIEHVQSLGVITREQDSEGWVVSHDATTAVLMTWYRNNVAHVLAVPGLIACLLINRRRPLAISELHPLVDAVLPYVADELTFEFDVDSADRWIGHLEDQGLIENRDESLAISRKDPNARIRLRLLANTVMPILERFYITVALLSQKHDEPLTKDFLLTRSHAIAERMSRLYGLNAPEFFDTGLFRSFVSALEDNGVVAENDDGRLSISEQVPMIVRAARGVIGAEFQQAVLRSGH